MSQFNNNFDLASAKWFSAKSLWGQNDDMIKEIFTRTDPVTSLMIAFTCKRFNRLVRNYLSTTNPDLLDTVNKPQWHLIFDKVYSRQSPRARRSIDNHFKNPNNKYDIIIYNCTDTKKQMKLNFSHVNPDDIVKYNGNIRLLRFAYFKQHLVTGYILPLKHSMIFDFNPNVSFANLNDFKKNVHYVYYPEKNNGKFII